MRVLQNFPLKYFLCPTYMFFVFFPSTSIFCTTEIQRTLLKKDGLNRGWGWGKIEKPGPKSSSVGKYHVYSGYVCV